MTVTGTSVLTNSVKTAYDKDYLYNLMMNQVWFNFIDWQDPVGGDLRGSTISQPVMEELAAVTSALSETTDVTPVGMVDDLISMSIAEYGNAVQLTRFLRVVSYTSVEQAAAKAVGQNQAKSLDLIIRGYAAGGTVVEYPGAVTARTDLDASNDKFTYEFATQLVTRAASMGVPPFEDGSYAAVVHPLLIKDVQNSTEWKAVGEYADPRLIYTGKPGQVYGGYKFKGEVGSLGGLRLIAHNLGKVFLSGGTAAQAATTISGAVTAGATAATVALATGLAVGDWITVDKGEATEEQVLITGVSGADLTIRGAGNKFSNFGFKYAHADTATVTEAANVAAIPVFGPNSIRGRFASEVGKNGEVRIAEKDTVIPGRFINHSWYWVGGFARMEKYLIRGECAVTGGLYGDNK
jgi:N4-gp56 family major capsid protein